MFLQLNGIPSEAAPVDESIYFYSDFQGAWLPSNGDLSSEIESHCVRLHDALAAKLFGDIRAYYDILPLVPEIFWSTGLGSESLLSRLDFERILRCVYSDPTSNKLLYLYDCRKLVSGIQECSKELIHIQGEFYKSLNLDQLFFPEIKEEDGVRFVTSPTTTKLFALLSFIFVRMNSMLDYITKLTFEIENLCQDFSEYPKLKSSKVIFGKASLNIYAEPGTIYEKNKVIQEVELIRNLVIHNGFIDDMPKVYKVVKDGCTIDKFILFPDKNDAGFFEKYKNRTLFYSGEDKINLRLPDLLNEFQSRVIQTLRLIREKYLDAGSSRE